MAQSVKIDFNVWSQFDHHLYQIINEDFVHDNLLTINANIFSDKGRVRLQQILISQKNDFSTKGQTNILFPLYNNKSLYFQYRTKGFRIHFDNGLIAQGHLNNNIYASIQSDRKLANWLFKIGRQTIAEKWRYNIRYRYSTETNNHTVYSRWRYDYKNWTFEGIKAFNLNDFILLKNSLLVGYYYGRKTFHVRLEHEGWRNHPLNFNNLKFNDLFDKLTFNFTKTISADHRIGVETGIKNLREFAPFSFVWESYDALLHNTVKIKLSSDNSVAFSLRNKMGSYGSYILGLGINQLGSLNIPKFGILVDLNL